MTDALTGPATAALARVLAGIDELVQVVGQRDAGEPLERRTTADAS